MLNDFHVLDLLPAYSLGILEDDEARQVAEHLAGCLSCRQELESYQIVSDQLPLAVTTAVPSAGLKPRLMERIHGLNAKPVPQSKGWQASRRWMPIGAVAGLVLILLLTLSNIFLWQRLNNLEVIRGPLGMRAIALQNTDMASAGSGFVIISADGKNGVLVVDHLPPIDESQEYQVWLMRDGNLTDAGTFEVDEDGYRGMRLTAPESLLSYSDVFVTVEPIGGSAQPTGEQILLGSLFNR